MMANAAARINSELRNREAELRCLLAMAESKVGIKQFEMPHSRGHVSYRYGQLIREGIDDGSRKHAKALLGPACGLKLKELVLGFARQHSPGITIDFFAAASNTLVTRYAAWTQEAGAELVDAFSARSWDHGMCVCGTLHRETGAPTSKQRERCTCRGSTGTLRTVSTTFCISRCPTRRLK